MSDLLHVFPLISWHELTPITDACQWNAHDHLEYTITEFVNRITRVIVFGMGEWREGKYRLWLRQGKPKFML